MRVTLGYPWEGYAPDTTIEVDDKVGWKLLHEGKARAAVDPPAPAPIVDSLAGVPLEKYTVTQLRQYIADHELPIDTKRLKRLDIVAAIHAAQEQARASESEGTPGAGDDHQEEPDVG